MRKFLILTTVVMTSAAVIGWSSQATDRTIQTITPTVEAKEVKEVEKKKTTPQERIFEIVQEALGTKEAITAITFLGSCENPHWQFDARNYNKPTKDCPRGSIDYGWWQINDCYQPQVKMSCKEDVECSTRAAIEIYKKWKNSWKAWSCAK